MNIFITGAAGTLGTEVIKQLQPYGYNIKGLTRNEHHLLKLRETCTPVLGDIRDRKRMIDVTKDIDIIFHFAALKHVDIMENNPDECLRTNLEGTKNLLHAQEINGIDRVIFTSTDKAVYPINSYGFCKAMSENLILQNPYNAVCRYGNVFGSKGSIFERLPGILKKTNTIKITHPEMSRFWIRIEDAAKFVLETGLKGKNGLHIPPMKSANVLKTLKLYAEYKGFLDYEIEEIGLRPGEKLHEDLSPDLSSNKCENFTTTELIDLFHMEHLKAK